MSHPVDVHAGRRLKQIRIIRGMSQTDLGKELNLTFQQIQKYEIGSNRLSASRIYELSKILDVAPAFFFEGFDDLEPTRKKEFQNFKLDNALASINDEAARERVRKLIEDASGVKIHKR